MQETKTPARSCPLTVMWCSFAHLSCLPTPIPAHRKKVTAQKIPRERSPLLGTTLGWHQIQVDGLALATTGCATSPAKAKAATATRTLFNMEQPQSASTDRIYLLFTTAPTISKPAKVPS